MFVRIFSAILVLVAGVMPTASVQAQPGYGPGGPGGEIECRSSGFNYSKCPVPWGGDVQMVRQLSDTQCQRGRNWDFDRRGNFIWVDRGCAGRFAAVGWNPGRDWNKRFSLRCESNGPQRFCQVDVGANGKVTLERRESSASCRDARNWGWNRAGVWVAQGCRGVFTIDRRW
jgi:hypothetical protein